MIQNNKNNKTTTILVNFSKSEKIIIQEIANQTSLPLSSLIRSMIVRSQDFQKMKDELIDLEIKIEEQTQKFDKILVE